MSLRLECKMRFYSLARLFILPLVLLATLLTGSLARANPLPPPPGNSTAYLPVHAPSAIGAAMPLVNTARIDTALPGQLSSRDLQLAAALQPDLAIQKEANTNRVAPGSDVVFTIRYQNVGNATATSVVITDVVPAGFTYVSSLPLANSAPAVGSNGTVVWNIASLAPSSASSVQLTVKATNPYTGANPTTNTATITAAGLSPKSDRYTISIQQSGESRCEIFYFSREQGYVGSAGVEKLAYAELPTSLVPELFIVPATDLGTSAEIPMQQFYMDPPSEAAVTFSGGMTTSLHIAKVVGPSTRFRAYVYDYNPTTGQEILLGTGVFDDPGTALLDLDTPISMNVDVNGKTLAAGHRLLWRFTAQNTGNPLLVTAITFAYDGTTRPSRVRYCEVHRDNLVLDKQISSLLVELGDTVTYTIQFANYGQLNATGKSGVTTDGNSCQIFYFDRESGYVGTTAGVQNLAERGSPTALLPAVATVPATELLFGAGEAEIEDFYMDPPTEAAIAFSGVMTTSLHLSKAAGFDTAVQGVCL